MVVSTPAEDDAPGSAPVNAGYSIGTVAGLTGLDPHTIRAWERRHAAVAPARSPRGTRRYSDGDVTRLQLLKAATDCGAAIGSIAALAEGELRELLSKLAGAGSSRADVAPETPRAIALLAPRLAAQLAADPAGLADLELVAAERALDAFLQNPAAVAAEILILELGALGREPLRAIEALTQSSQPRVTVVIYDFATAAELARIARTGVRLVRGPLRLAQLRQALQDFLVIEATAPAALAAPSVARSGDEGFPPRRFDDAQLARLLEFRSAVPCECPSHVASLLVSAGGFERYSRECESRSPADALLHRHLALSAAQIRARLEQLLERVCDHEGIRI